MTITEEVLGSILLVKVPGAINTGRTLVWVANLSGLAQGVSHRGSWWLDPEYSETLWRCLPEEWVEGEK